VIQGLPWLLEVVRYLAALPALVRIQIRARCVQ